MTLTNEELTQRVIQLEARLHEELNRTISESDERNGIASTLEFAAEGVRRGGEDGRQYLLGVSRGIASGAGYPAPNPGPVTPTE